MDPRWRKQWQLFHSALELPDTERQAFLERECGDDDAMQREVQALLRADAEAPTSLPLAHLDELAAERFDPRSLIGERLGAFLVRELIGEGGMGVVYLADQVEGVQRKVAIKVVKFGLGSFEVLQRFAHEREVLARLQHPNIATIFEVGATADGRPFFAMEYVPGASLVDYADAERLDAHQRIDLFLYACRAVSFAHRKGVLHRDLKPANLLVGQEQDGVVLKVIDFGVAKTLLREADPDRQLTRVGQPLGTLDYMSPEQEQLGGSDVDTRTDVYSLGRVLEALLQNVDRPRSVDWIIEAATREDPDHRYASVDALAADLERCLTHQPLSAGPTSSLYRAKLFLRRNRGLVTVIAAVAFGIATGIVGLALGWQRSQIANFEAEIARERALQTSNLLQNLLAGVDPEIARGRDTAILEDILARAETEIDRELQTSPVVAAALVHTLAATRYGLGEFERALDHARRAVALRSTHLGEDHLDTLISRSTHGLILWELGRLDEAEAELADTASRLGSTVGPTHRSTLIAKNNFALVVRAQGRLFDAEPLYREVLELRRRAEPPDPDAVAGSASNYSFLLQQLGRADEAIAPAREALALLSTLGKESTPDYANALDKLGNAQRDLADLEAAVASHREAYRLQRRIRGPSHPNTLISAYFLGRVLREAGNVDDAQPILEDLRLRAEARLGAESRQHLVALHQLALCAAQLERVDAEQQLRTALARTRDALGDEHGDTANVSASLGRFLAERGEIEEGRQFLQRALETFERRYQFEHPRLVALRQELLRLGERSTL